MPKSRRARALTVGVALALLVGLFSVDYTVERGDTLRDIARDHDLSLTDLIAANDLANPNLIYPGQVLIIPGDEVEPEVSYVVVRGDTLGLIASRFDSSVSALVTRNAISNPNLIRIGQSLLVPGAGAIGSTTTSSGSSPSAGGRSGQAHIVQPGERLAGIAAKYDGVTADQIAKANGIIDGVIYRGTRLFLDGPSYTGNGTSGQISYTVQSGDRLGDIAAAHGTTVPALASENSISNPNLIRSGQTLLIPSGNTWVCPVANTSFFNDWGFPRSGGERYHEGNDLFTKHGAPVYAPVSGTVSFTTGSIGGKQFNLAGNDGVMYLGSHMSGFGSSGRVNAGDVVGYVGNTGNAAGTPSHLHFGMYMNDGVPINPYPTLVKYGCK